MTRVLPFYISLATISTCRERLQRALFHEENQLKRYVRLRKNSQVRWRNITMGIDPEYADLLILSLIDIIDTCNQLATSPQAQGLSLGFCWFCPTALVVIWRSVTHADPPWCSLEVA